jgi:hypothetical protein
LGNIKICFQETACEGVDWIKLAQGMHHSWNHLTFSVPQKRLISLKAKLASQDGVWAKESVNLKFTIAAHRCHISCLPGQRCGPRNGMSRARKQYPRWHSENWRRLQIIPCCHTVTRAEVAQSVQCLSTDWTAMVRSLTEAEDFSSTLCVQTGSGAHPASCTVSTGGKARPGRDADHSPPSSSEVKKE